MTQRDDLDRLLGDWLAEGPARTPEPVLATALQHARSHPRRPDPFAFLRRDPMAGRTSPFAVAPLPVFAVIGLLVLAALGVSIVGGQRDDVPPTDSVPTPVPSALVASPSPSPDELPALSFPIRVGLQTGTAAAMVVDVTDASGLLVDARTGTPAEGGSVPGGTVTATNVDERTVLLTWTDSVCDIEYALQVETTTSMTLTAPPCVGDTVAQDRRLLLQFAVPVDASVVEVRVLAQATPSASGSADLSTIASVEVPGGEPPMTVTLRGDPTVVTGVRPATGAEVEAATWSDEPSTNLAAYDLSPTELVVVWIGGACDVSATMTVESDRIGLADDPSPPCDAIGIGKGVVLTFADPVDPAARELVLVRATPGP